MPFSYTIHSCPLHGIVDLIGGRGYTEPIMAKQRNTQVGFRDDTSYLAAHYGRRLPFQRARGTAKTPPAAVDAMSVPITATVSTKSASPKCSAGFASDSPSIKVSSNNLAGRRSMGHQGGQNSGEASISVKPTLSEQLASIGKAAEDITVGIRKSYGLKPLEGAAMTTPSESFLVGKLRCKYPSPVHFFNHKCVYTFHHPFEATRITMEMFFRDMRCATLDVAKRRLRFKIDHALCHYGKDYSHEDPSHFVAIIFSSGLDVERVMKEIMPLIRSAGGVR